MYNEVVKRDKNAMSILIRKSIPIRNGFFNNTLCLRTSTYRLKGSLLFDKWDGTTHDYKQRCQSPPYHYSRVS